MIRYLFWGVAPAVEHKAVLESLSLKTLIDIGANKGQFSLAAKTTNPNLIIHAFEPLATPARLFTRVFKNFENVSLHQLAVSEREEETDMHISKSIDSSSLLEISARQREIFPGTDESHTEIVTITRLDKVLTKEHIVQPSLLKIDVQGNELPTLKGCETLLTAFDYIYVECSFVELYVGQVFAHEVIHFLESHDFCIEGIYDVNYDKQGLAVQADFLFCRHQ